MNLTIDGILSATVRMAAPLLLASMGGLFSAKSGMISLYMEGFMLIGAFCGYLGAVFFGSLLIGVLCAIAGGMLFGLIYGVLGVSARADQTIVCVGINVFALGLTSYLYSILFGANRVYNVPTFQDLPIPVLSKIPVIGGMFSSTLLVYLAFALLPLVWYIFYRTPAGLTIRAAGEHPKAVETLGGNVIAVRYGCLLAAGALNGLAGCALTIGQSGQFMENITSGKGYIAVAALIFGKFSPGGILLATLLFGFTDALQLRIQTAEVGIPHQLLTMLPYLITLAALVFFAKKAHAPAALGRPYQRQN
jgi:ABC-type uncharacterized transport system permease subunit